MIALEIALDALPAPKAKTGKTKPVFDKADQTPVKRDFAFVVDEKVPAGDITRMAMKADPKLVDVSTRVRRLPRRQHRRGQEVDRHRGDDPAARRRR